MQNNGDKIDWNDEDQEKWCICYSHINKNLSVDCSYMRKSLEIYFHTKEAAQRAIDEIIIPFMKEHPEFIW